MHKKYPKTKTNYRSMGFTLIEVLLVISIVGLLSTIILTSLRSARFQAIDAKTILDLDGLAKAAELYNAENGSYPNLIPYGLGYVTSLPTPPGWPSDWANLQGLLFPYTTAPRPPYSQATYLYYGNKIDVHGDNNTCLRINDGYYIEGTLYNQAKGATDGGEFSTVYEVYGGDYQLYHGNCP